MSDRPQTPPATAARLYLLVVGVGLVLGGVAGFLYESDFGRGADLVADDILGLFPTNGIDNVLHLAIGLLSLAAASRAARPGALAVGGALAALGLWGLLVTDRGFGSLLETIPVETADNLLHLLAGLAGLAAVAFDATIAAPERAAGRRRHRERGQGRRLRS